MLTYLGTIAALEAHEIDEEILLNTRHLHVSSFFLQKGLHEGIVDIFARARKEGVTVSLDPGWDPEEKRNGPLQSILEYIDVFLPNAQEAKHITSTESVEDALRKLGSYVALPVIKMGEKGACTLQSGKLVCCPGFHVNSVDATGAGDSFDAGFLYGYLRDFKWMECLRWGCACGALSTMKTGGIAAQPTVSEVKDFLKQDGQRDN